MTFELTLEMKLFKPPAPRPSMAKLIAMFIQARVAWVISFILRVVKSLLPLINRKKTTTPAPNTPRKMIRQQTNLNKQITFLSALHQVPPQPQQNTPIVCQPQSLPQQYLGVHHIPTVDTPTAQKRSNIKQLNLINSESVPGFPSENQFGALFIDLDQTFLLTLGHPSIRGDVVRRVQIPICHHQLRATQTRISTSFSTKQRTTSSQHWNDASDCTIKETRRNKKKTHL